MGDITSAKKIFQGLDQTRRFCHFRRCTRLGLSFRHPISERKMELVAPIPKRLTTIVDLLRVHRSA